MVGVRVGRLLIVGAAVGLALVARAVAAFLDRPAARHRSRRHRAVVAPEAPDHIAERPARPGPAADVDADRAVEDPATVAIGLTAPIAATGIDGAAAHPAADHAAAPGVGRAIGRPVGGRRGRGPGIDVDIDVAAMAAARRRRRGRRGAAGRGRRTVTTATAAVAARALPGLGRADDEKGGSRRRQKATHQADPLKAILPSSLRRAARGRRAPGGGKAAADFPAQGRRPVSWPQGPQKSTASPFFSQSP
jgi:hypothetical protein